MKPIAIVLTINLSFYAIWGLFFAFLMNRPELIPLITSLQAAINVLCAGGFYVDRQKKISLAFAIGALLTIAVTVAGYFFLIKYRHLIGVEENYTAYLQAVVANALKA